MTLSSGLELDFRDSWRNNVAAYRLDRLLGLRMVPVTVVRVDDHKTASFTWWVDDVLMTEKERFQKKINSPDADAWNRQIFVVRIFDQLIYNVDRNLGNLLIEKDWTIWMIDHTRAFKIFKDLKVEKNLGATCEKDFFASLRTLDKATLQPLMKDLLADGADRRPPGPSRQDRRSTTRRRSRPGARGRCSTTSPFGGSGRPTVSARRARPGAPDSRRPSSALSLADSGSSAATSRT